VELATNTGAWVVVAGTTELEFVRDVPFVAAAVLFAMPAGTEVLEITYVVFGNVAGAVDAVDNAATVVVLRATEDVDSDLVADDVVVGLLYEVKVMLDEVFDASEALDVKTGRDDVRMSEDVLLDTGVSDVVVFKNVLEVARATEDEVIVLEAKVIPLLVVFNTVVAKAEEDEVWGTGIVLVATLDG